MDDRTSILEFLKRGRWFGGLDPALQQLIVQRAHVVRFARGDLLSEEGKPPTGLYAVLAGHVRVTRRLANGVEVPVHIAGKGFWTGEYATFSGQRVIGSIVAETRGRALFLPAAEFERIVDEDPRRFRAFMALMLERHRLAYGTVAELQGLASEALLARRSRDWRRCGATTCRSADRSTSGSRRSSSRRCSACRASAFPPCCTGSSR
jgi:CRP-like cAMP-binding protein